MPAPDRDELQLVFVTAPGAEIGARIARTLVEERLAACVNVVSGVRSVYRWEGKIEEETEVLLIAKTRAGCCEALAGRVREIHPYALPEILALPVVGGSEPYRAWVTAETLP